MIADGITIDIYSLLKIKDQLLRVMGYRDVSLVPSANGHNFYVQFEGITNIPLPSLSCISDLMLILDAPHPFELSCAAMGGPDKDDETLSPLIIGSPFVDVLLDLLVTLEHLSLLPPLPLKNLLKALIIVLQKHDFDSMPLRYLQAKLRNALRNCLGLLSDDEHLSLELRQLALSACQVFINRWATANVIGLFI